MADDATFFVNGKKIENNIYKSILKKVTKDDVISLKVEYDGDEDDYWITVYVLDLETKERYLEEFFVKNQEHKFRFDPDVYGHNVKLHICMDSEVRRYNLGPAWYDDFDDDDDDEECDDNVEE